MISIDESLMYIFCVDTEQYAGNFERKLCAYMTGAVADCGVGFPEARDWYINIAKQEWMKEAPYTSYDLVRGAEDWDGFVNIQTMSDDEGGGILRPCTIIPTPGQFNQGNDERNHPVYNSLGIFFCERPADWQIRIMIDRAKEFAEKTKVEESLRCDNDITIIGFRLMKQSTTLQEIELDDGSGKN